MKKVKKAFDKLLRIENKKLQYYYRLRNTDFFVVFAFILHVISIISCGANALSILIYYALGHGDALIMTRIYHYLVEKYSLIVFMNLWLVFLSYPIIIVLGILFILTLTLFIYPELFTGT